MTGTPFIPRTIVVHLGRPDQAAENVYVTFPDYIKNVASGEIYPTWPQAALRANIYAQISYALNRYYTEFYRSQGYDFDITNSTQFDQSYKPGREIFDNISDIVDEIFDSYVVQGDNIEPYFTQYCNGTTTTCSGLSQWGTVPLAEEGLGPYDILARFYGDNINIVTDAPVMNGQPSYPGVALRLGDAGNDVQEKQIQLNRIGVNYPGIPKITPTDGTFGVSTEEAVRAFQRIFGLTQDGIIGKATWYRLSYLFNAVKRLSELDSEGISVSELPQQYERLLSLGDEGDDVRVIQYFLNVVGAFYDTVPRILLTGVYDEETAAAVRAYQQAFGLDVDGIVGRLTWQSIQDTYEGIMASTNLIDGGVPLFPGRVLSPGIEGEDVLQVQEYLAYLATVYPDITAPPTDGVYGPETAAAVAAFQRLFGLPDNGNVGVTTWDTLAAVYSNVRFGNTQRPGQYPGTDFGQEVSG